MYLKIQNTLARFRKIAKKLCFQKKIFRHNGRPQSYNTFLRTMREKSPESKKNFTGSPKKIKKPFCRKVSVCYESDDLDTYNAALTTLPQNFLP